MSQSPIEPVDLLRMSLKILECPLPAAASESDLENWLLQEFGKERFHTVSAALTLNEMASKICRTL